MKGFRQPKKVRKCRYHGCTNKPKKKGLCQMHLALMKRLKAIKDLGTPFTAPDHVTISDFHIIDEQAPFDEAAFQKFLDKGVSGPQPEGQEGSGVEPQALHVDQDQPDRGDRGLGPGLLPGEHGEVYRSAQAESRPAGFAQGPMVFSQEDPADGEGAEEGLTEEEQAADAKDWHRTYGDLA